jgi:hypothetical protein
MGGFLLLLGIAVLGIGVFTLIRGHLRWAHLRSRRSAWIAVAAAVVLVGAGGSLLPQPVKAPVAQSAHILTAVVPTMPASTFASSSPAAPTSSMPIFNTAATPMPPTQTQRAAASSAHEILVAQAVVQAKLLAESRARAASSAASRSSNVSASKAAQAAAASQASASSRASASAVAAAESSASAAAEAASRASASVAASSASAAAEAASRASASVATAASASAAAQASAASAAAASARAAAAQTTTAAATNRCGAPANPYGYNYCGTGSMKPSPPADICNYFSCIPNFDNGTGYMEECQDGMVSMSGGLRGACSHHGGEQTPVEGP